MKSRYFVKILSAFSFNIYSRAIDDLNLKFKKPANDTCQTCDILTMKINSEKQEEQREIHKSALEAHHQEADLAYKSKQLDKETSVTFI